MNDLALSTSWNSARHDNAAGLIGEIKAAGFSAVELNFKLSRQVVDQVFLMVEKAQIRVRSLHNYCPMVDGIKVSQASPDYFSLSCLREDERKKAVSFSTETIRQAARLRARAVVLHCGRVDADDHTRRLIALYDDSKRESREFEEMLAGMVSERSHSAKPHIEQLYKSLRQLAQVAYQEGIILGIENRFYFMEIPSINEIAEVLDEFSGPTVSYWHDVGHAQVSQELGFAMHKDFLERFKARLAGIHFHDLIGARDHMAPGSGNLDFSFLKPYISDKIIGVIEVNQTQAFKEVSSSKAYLERILEIGAR